VAEVVEIGVILVEVAEVEGLEEATASNVGSLATGLASVQLVETAVELVAVGTVMAVMVQVIDMVGVTATGEVEEVDMAVIAVAIDTVTALVVQNAGMEDPMLEKVVEIAIEKIEAVIAIRVGTDMQVLEDLHVTREAPEIVRVLMIDPVEAHVRMTIVTDNIIYLARTAQSFSSSS